MKCCRHHSSFTRKIENCNFCFFDFLAFFSHLVLVLFESPEDVEEGDVVALGGDELLPRVGRLLPLALGVDQDGITGEQGYYGNNFLSGTKIVFAKSSL